MLGASFLLLVGMAWSQDDKDETSIQKRIVASAHVLDEIMSTPDKAIPDKVMHDAKCIAVIPSMVKIAVGFGGSHGKGVAVCRLANGRWSAPAPITITGGSWGLQLGGQADRSCVGRDEPTGNGTSAIQQIQDRRKASAAAGPVGRDAGADTDWKMKAEMLTYSRARGLFAGVDLSGAVIEQDKDETHLLYGKFVPFQDILTGKVRPPAGSGQFEATVRKYANQAGDTGHEHGKMESSSTTESGSR